VPSQLIYLIVVFAIAAVLVFIAGLGKK